jgi:O-antigen/teichoic acid export membrane protein
MSQGKLKRAMFWNTVSNYWTLAIHIVMMVLLVKVQFQGIPREDYGFWGLLWSVFGYSLLLDFGFGTSVQKYTSEVSVTGNWKKYNQLVSTIFFNYCILALIIIAVTLVLSGFVGRIFSFEQGSDIARYRTIFIMFGIGTAMIFPLGFFAEILRGIQLIRLRNYITICCSIVNFLGIVAAIMLGYSLMAMTLITVVTHLTANLVMAFFSFRKMPEFKIHFSDYKFSLMREVMSFSFFAYLIMFSNLIIFQTDQIVISIFASVELVAFYQIASRLAGTFMSFSTQFNDNLGPIASVFHTSGRNDELASMQLYTSRIIGFIATFMLVPLVAYIGPLLEVWLELTEPASRMCSIILLISTYFLVLFRSGSVQILLMCGREKELTVVAVTECLMNLVLSIILVRYLGIVGVALGTMIPNIVLGCFYNIPTACKFAKVGMWEFFSFSIFKTLAAGAVSVIFAYWLLYIHYPDSLLMLLAFCCAAGSVYLLIFYIIGISREERSKFNRLVLKSLRERKI